MTVLVRYRNDKKSKDSYPKGEGRGKLYIHIYEAASELLVCSLLVSELGRPLSISTSWGSSLNPGLNEISL